MKTPSSSGLVAFVVALLDVCSGAEWSDFLVTAAAIRYYECYRASVSNLHPVILANPQQHGFS